MAINQIKSNHFSHWLLHDICQITVVCRTNPSHQRPNDELFRLLSESKALASLANHVFPTNTGNSQPEHRFNLVPNWHNQLQFTRFLRPKEISPLLCLDPAVPPGSPRGTTATSMPESLSATKTIRTRSWRI
jgi:hypothetical protein